MKKLILLSVLMFLFGAITILAQPGNRGGRSTGNRSQNTNAQGKRGQNKGSRANQSRKGRRTLRGLDLSDDQKQQVKDIRTNAKESGADRETVNGQIRSVLNEEQAAKYDAKLEKKRLKRERKREKRERKRQRREERRNAENSTDETSDTNPE